MAGVDLGPFAKIVNVGWANFRIRFSGISGAGWHNLIWHGVRHNGKPIINIVVQDSPAIGGTTFSNFFSEIDLVDAFSGSAATLDWTATNSDEATPALSRIGVSVFKGEDFIEDFISGPFNPLQRPPTLDNSPTVIRTIISFQNSLVNVNFSYDPP